MSLVETRNLVKYFSDVVALKGINLSLEEGKIIGLLGPNASGKTTLIKVLVGLLKEYQGEVFVDGQDLGVHTKEIVSYLPDGDHIFPRYTVNQCIDFYKTFFNDFNESKAVDLINMFSIPLNKQIKHLSKGTIEKVQLVLTLSREAKLYIFDEPIAGVDPATRDLIFDLILNHYNKGSSILISTHLIYDVEPILDDVIFIKEGNIVLHKDKVDVVAEYGSVEGAFKEMFKWSIK
ncbi:MAG: ABC transporter ATP-binding protein [Bacillales bacterium]|jgi:ABC-2 type transport system ATP-binding protein|nr:ABC transporter ATP-binding protein [Bacillales bacterium]